MRSGVALFLCVGATMMREHKKRFYNKCWFHPNIYYRTVNKDSDFLKKFQTVKDNGFECCQLSNWDMSLYTDDCAKMINDAVSRTGVEISTLWAGWSEPREWNFTGGPMTLGIVPPDFRMRRQKNLSKRHALPQRSVLRELQLTQVFFPKI